MLCVLMRFAPFITDITSDIIDGINRSLALSPNKCPINDFLDTDTQIGLENVLSLSSLEITSMSLIYQGKSSIFVKKGPLPSILKNPIEGSIIILSSETFAFS